jgi:peptidoglycan/xylan/chitin deacetylase (PgdA/CDA1 family)
MGSQHVVNICFHGIGAPQRILDPGEDQYWITVDLFTGILDQVSGRPDVRISFDDGNASDREIGLEGLRQFGLTATFFALAGRLDKPGSLSSDDLSELVGAGMRIGSHGMDHVPWRAMDQHSRDRELVQARALLAEASGVPVDEAALPLGRYDRRVLQQLRRLGYATVYSSDRARARQGAWFQPRYSVRRGDTQDSVRSDILSRPPLSRTLKAQAVGLVKRLR